MWLGMYSGSLGPFCVTNLLRRRGRRKPGRGGGWETWRSKKTGLFIQLVTFQAIRRVPLVFALESPRRSFYTWNRVKRIEQVEEYFWGNWVNWCLLLLLLRILAPLFLSDGS